MASAMVFHGVRILEPIELVGVLGGVGTPSYTTAPRCERATGMAGATGSWWRGAMMSRQPTSSPPASKRCSGTAEQPPWWQGLAQDRSPGGVVL